MSSAVQFPQAHSDHCKGCRVPRPDDFTSCPDCDRRLVFSNVYCAQRHEQTTELDRRYDVAVRTVHTRGTIAILVDFEALCSKSQTVVGCDRNKVSTVIPSERHRLISYCDLISHQSKSTPTDQEPDWHEERPISQSALLGSPKHHDQLHYAGSRLSEQCLPSYDTCEVHLRKETVAHRVSHFLSNSAVDVDRIRHHLPAGFAADWSSRGIHCVAMHQRNPSITICEIEFPRILLKPATDSLDVRFVTNVLFGTLTFHAFRRIQVRCNTFSKPSSPQRRHKKAGFTKSHVLHDYCQGFSTKGVQLERIEI